MEGDDATNGTRHYDPSYLSSKVIQSNMTCGIYVVARQLPLSGTTRRPPASELTAYTALPYF